jgi:hypothetical protein
MMAKFSSNFGRSLRAIKASEFPWCEASSKLERVESLNGANYVVCPFRRRHSSSASPRDGSVSNVSPSHVPQQPLQGDAPTPRAKPALETLATQTAEQKFANRKISFASGGEKVEEVGGWRAKRAHER